MSPFLLLGTVQVSYDVTGFLEKNKDFVHRDLSKLLSRSSSSLLQRLTVPAETFSRRSSVGPPSRRGKGKAPTLSAKFKGQLRDMVNQLSACQPHFIRCLKPNARSVPGEFDPRLMLAQIRCTGLEQVCRIRQAGYPVRMDREDLERRLRHLSSATGAEPVKLDVLLRQLERIGVLLAGMWVEGSTKVFFKHSALARLDAHEATMDKAASAMQAFVRGTSRRRDYGRWRALRVELRAASAQRDVDRIDSLLQQCAEQLPFGGKSLAEVRTAQKGLELAGEELLVCQKLKDAGTRRDIDALRDAIAKAEELHACTTVASEVASSQAHTNSKLWNEIQAARSRLEGAEGEAMLVTAMEIHDYAQLVAAVDKIAPGAVEAELSPVVVQARALIVSMEEDMVAVLRVAVDTREKGAILAALGNVRDMGLPPEAMAEAVETLDAIEQESRNAAELDEARRKLAFTARVCSPDDRQKLMAALDVARSAGLGPRDEAVLVVRRLIVQSTLSAALGSADKVELKAAIDEAAWLDEKGPLITQVQGELGRRRLPTLASSV